MRAAEARALTSSGIAQVALSTEATFVVNVEGRPVGFVMKVADGWLAVTRSGVEVARGVSRRHAAVRRLLMYFDYRALLAPGGPPDD